MEGKSVTSRGTRLAISFATAIALSISCGSFTREELACEQAVSKLSDCCRGFDARRLPCVEVQGGCNGDADPVLTLKASKCVVDTSCDALLARGTCSRLVAQSLVPHPLKDREEIEEEACR